MNLQPLVFQSVKWIILPFQNYYESRILSQLKYLELCMVASQKLSERVLPRSESSIDSQGLHLSSEEGPWVNVEWLGGFPSLRIRNPLSSVLTDLFSEDADACVFCPAFIDVLQEDQSHAIPGTLRYMYLDVLHQGTSHWAYSKELLQNRERWKGNLGPKQ